MHAPPLSVIGDRNNLAPSVYGHRYHHKVLYYIDFGVMGQARLNALPFLYINVENFTNPYKVSGLKATWKSPIPMMHDKPSVGGFREVWRGNESESSRERHDGSQIGRGT
jgi:hypothetical protein